MPSIEAIQQQTEAALSLPPREAWRPIRLAARVPQAWVANYCKVSRQAISAWEDGSRMPTGEHLVLYARALRAMRGLA